LAQGVHVAPSLSMSRYQVPQSLPWQFHFIQKPRTMSSIFLIAFLAFPAAGLQKDKSDKAIIRSTPEHAMQSESRTDHKGLRKDKPGNSSSRLKPKEVMHIESHGNAKGDPETLGDPYHQDGYPYSQDGDYDFPGEGPAANGGNGVKNGGLYRMKSQYPGTWFNAELSWDEASSHPMASVETDDPVTWKFDEYVGGKNQYIITSMKPGRWYGAELSWDTASPHPMASVENNDRVYWELVQTGNMQFRIVSKYPGDWLDAELSWDTRSPHPMASVEHNDPVDWKLVEVAPS